MPTEPTSTGPHKAQAHVRERRAVSGARGHVLFHLLAISVLLGALVAFATQIAPPTPCKFIAAWSPHLETPLVPDNLAGANDRRAIEQGGYFSDETFQFEPSLSSSMLRRQLISETIDAYRPLVVYLSALARVDDKGQLVLLTKDYVPLSPHKAGLPLVEVLKLLAANQASQKLLVLDISTALESGQAGLFPEEISAEAIAALEQVEDPDRLVLLSSDVGQHSHVLPGVGRTSFGYFFEQGISGWADAFNESAVSDGRVSARELAAYVANRVDSWSKKCASSRQTPLLVGDADDFVLTAADRHSQPPQLYQAKVEEYPDWLRQAWQFRHDCLAADMLHTYPLLVRRIDDTVLEVERRWRYCGDEQSLKAYWDATRGPAQRLLDKLTAASQQPVSLGRLSANGLVPNPELLAAWKVYFADIDRLDTIADPKARQKQHALLTTNLEGQLAEHAPPEVLLALVETLPSTSASLAVCLPAAADYLQQHGYEGSYLELSAICELANLLAIQSALTEDDLRLTMQVIFLGERASGLPIAEPYIEGLLIAASAHRLEGEVIVFNPGCGPLDHARGELQAALSLYQQAEHLQKVAAAAVGMRNRAYAELPAVLPLVRATPALMPAWKECTRQSKRLCKLLSPELRAEFNDQAPIVEQLTSSIAQHLAELETQLELASIDQLAAELKQGSITKRSVADAVLATPLVPLDKRLELLKAMETFDAGAASSLDALAMRSDLATIRKAMKPRREESDGSHEGWAEAEFALLIGEMGGLEMAEFRKRLERAGPTAEINELSDLSNLLAKAYSTAAQQASSPRDLWREDCVARIMPAGYQQGVFSGNQYRPSAQLAALLEADWATREHARLTAAAVNPLPAPLYAPAAQRIASGNLTAHSQWNIVGPDAQTELSEQHPTAAVQFAVSGTKASPTAKVLRPNSALQTSTNVKPASDGCLVDLDLTIATDAAHAELVAIEGVLVKLTSDDAIRYHLLRLPGVSRSSPIDAWLTAAGVERPVDGIIAIPPASSPFPVDLILRNRSKIQQQVSVNFTCGAVFSNTITLPAGETKSALQGATPSGELGPIDINSLQLEVHDAGTSESLLSRSCELTVLNPLDYVELEEGWIERHGASFSLRLPVRLLASGLNSSSVQLALDPNGTSTLVSISGGQMAAVLSTDRPRAEVTAKLKPSAAVQSDESLLWNVAMDGVDRAYCLACRVPTNGESVPLTPLEQPIVRLASPELVRSGADLAFSTKVQAAPRGARIEARLYPASNASLAPARQLALGLARPDRIVAQPTKKGGLQLSATIADAAGGIDTTGLMGRFRLEVLLTDQQGKVLAKDEQPVVVDGSPAGPTNLALVAAPAVAGAPANFRINTTDNLSGVGSVQLFVGTPDDNQPPKDAKLIKAHADPASPHTWVATLPLPADQPSVEITAMVTNGVGLNSFTTIDLLLKTAAEAALGQVAGKVTEGGRAQAGLPVELRAADKSVVAKATSTAKGSFSFTGVKPGDYLIWCTKSQSQRTGSAKVKVQQGKTAEASLELSL